MIIEISNAAQQDLLDGYHFYEAQTEGIGTYFLDSLTSDIDSLIIYAGLQAKQQANNAAHTQITAIRLQQLQQEQAQSNATTQEYHRHILRAPLNPINRGPTAGVADRIVP